MRASQDISIPPICSRSLLAQAFQTFRFAFPSSFLRSYIREMWMVNSLLFGIDSFSLTRLQARYRLDNRGRGKMERKIELWIACKCINMRAILDAIRDPQLSREMHTTFFQPACCNLNLSNDLVPITFRIRYFTRLINISEGDGRREGEGRQTGKSSVSNCIDSNKVGRGRNYVYNYYRAQFPRNNYGLIDIRNRSWVETFPTRSPSAPSNPDSCLRWRTINKRTSSLFTRKRRTSIPLIGPNSLFDKLPSSLAHSILGGKRSLGYTSQYPIVFSGSGLFNACKISSVFLFLFFSSKRLKFRRNYCVLNHWNIVDVSSFKYFQLHRGCRLIECELWSTCRKFYRVFDYLSCETVSLLVHS